MSTRFFYVRLFGAQILAFAVSFVLNKSVFLKGTPIVRADFSTRIAHLPETVFDSVKKNPQKTITSGKKIGISNQVSPTVVITIPTDTPTPQPTTTPSPEPTRVISPTPRPTSSRLPTNPPFQPTKTPTSVPVIPTTKPTSPPSSGSNSAAEQETINIINQKRQQQGLSTLSPNDQLTAAARGHSSDMNTKGFCGHNGSDGSDPSSRVKAAGYTTFVSLGETVGCQQPNPQALVDAWWASPGHHAILVDPGMKFIGMGWVGSYQTAVLVQ